MKIVERLVPILLIFIGLSVSGASIYVSSERALTNLENSLLQAFALVFGLVGSFIFGKHSARDAAREIIKPHARSAFRRLISLYESLSRVGAEIEHSKIESNKQADAVVLAKLEAIVVEQLATADDALEDWADIVPEEVSELRNRLTAPRNEKTKS